MNREASKSILLAALVVLSLFLTWSIWTYQGNFESEKDDKTPTIKPIDPENELSFSKVVRPYQLIHKRNGGNTIVGTDSQTIVDTVYGEILSVNWSTLLGGPSTTGENVYELVFPAPIKLDTIQTLFKFTQSKTSLRNDWLIDRVTIYDQKTPSGEGSVLVFKGADETPRFYATSNEDLLKKIGDSIEKGNLETSFHSYKEVQLKGKKVFIPKDTVQYNRLTYPYTLVDIKDFKPIFFSDLLMTFYSNNAYSDGDSLLRQDDGGNILKYVNPAAGTNSVIRDPIYQSYQFINSHKGWTDNFMYDYSESSPSESQDNVDFRLTENGLPVYSVSGYPTTETLISTTWENGILYKLERTLINVGKLYSNDPTQLVSGEEVMKVLDSNHISLKSLQDLRIGYRMEVNSNQRLLNFKPDWYFKIGDHWTSLTDYEGINTPSPSSDGGS